jgi:hypothetical protein
MAAAGAVGVAAGWVAVAAGWVAVALQGVPAAVPIDAGVLVDVGDLVVFAAPI